MLKLISDENFNGDILRGLYRRRVDLDIVRVQDVGLTSTADQTILEWAAAQERVLLTHDRETMPRFAFERMKAGMSMSGVFLVSGEMPIGQAIDELFLAITCLSAEECRNFVRFFPL